MSYRLTLLLQGVRGRASEAYYSGVGTDKDAKAVAAKLADLRAQTLGVGSSVAAVRLEACDGTGKPVYALAPQYRDAGALPWPADLTRVIADKSVVSDPPSPEQLIAWAHDVRGTSFELKFTLAGGTNKPIIKSTGYMSFVPDIVVSTVNDPTLLKDSTVAKALDVWIKKAFTPWKSYLQTGGAFKRRGRDYSAPIYQIQQAIQGNPLVSPPVFASVIIPGVGLNFKIGDKVQIKGRNNKRHAGRQKELNGFWQVNFPVEAGGNTQLYLTCSMNVAVNPCRPLGTLQKVLYNLNTITGVEPLFASQRRRGV